MVNLKNKTRGLLIALIVLTLSIPLFGQRNIRNLEIKLDQEVSKAIAIPVEKKGVLVMQRSKTKTADGKRNAFFRLYNTELSEDWKVAIPIDKKHELSQYKFVDGLLYMVFTDPWADYIQVVRINPAESESTLQKFYTFKGLNFYDLDILGDKLYLVGAMKRQSLLMMFDMESKGTRLFNTQLGNSECVIKSIVAKTEDNTIHVTLNNPELKTPHVAVRSFDDLGKILNEMLVHIDKDYQVLESELVDMGDKGKTLIGTYASKKSTAAEGIFIKNESWEAVNYHPIKSITDFVPEAYVEGGEKSTKKGEFIAINKVMNVNGQFVMVTESYDLVYDNDNNPLTHKYEDPERSFNQVWAVNDLSYNKVPMAEYTRRLTAVAGYQLKYASMISFSESGKLLWGKNLGIADENISKEYKRLKVIKDDNRVKFLNNYSGDVMEIDLEQKTAGMAKDTPASVDKDGNPIGSVVLSAAHWYDNYYLNIEVMPDNVSSSKKGAVLVIKKVRG
ncbi:hypothetical protein R9C00_04460 [Flammeovirgaceae bacterium SG7u.111]|nr:hypothetical protein [Flammeovirgaceae bacterium SG7u.132]WPO36699.1 hypothetical protein R9C00_04460 [Flammeovirgaceae bacterium SG7u.111]